MLDSLIAANHSEPASPIPISAQYARAFDDDDQPHNGSTSKVPVKRARLFGKGCEKNDKGLGVKKIGRVRAKAMAKAKVAAKVSEKSGASKESSAGFGLYQPHLYSEKYQVFVQAAMKDGARFKDAKAQWLSSQDRANLLADMPLPELKRRKFVCKECQSNPFIRVNPQAALGGC